LSNSLTVAIAALAKSGSRADRPIPHRQPSSLLSTFWRERRHRSSSVRSAVSIGRRNRVAVRVMHVRHMGMLVHEPFMAMPVGVRLTRWIAGPMVMLMMRIVHMRVTVLQRIMDVFVLMLLRQVQPHPEAYEQARDHELEGDGFAQKKDGRDGADEGRRRKIRARARRPEMAQRRDEKSKADAVTEETHDPRQRYRNEARKTAADKEAKGQTDGTGNEALQLDDLKWIGQRHLAREIVVQPPCSARAGDGEGAEQAGHRRFARPCEYGSARDQTRHADRDAPVEILMKDEPRHQRRGDTFERQQQ